MNIKVRESSTGECNIKTYSDIGKKEEYLIKTFCGYQLLCMNGATEDPEKFKQLLDILTEMTEKINKLYKETASDPTEQF